MCLCRGKGDYHRLGHGNDDHVRRPRRVTALQGKKIISIACGSLHCIAVSDSGYFRCRILTQTVKYCSVIIALLAKLLCLSV